MMAFQKIFVTLSPQIINRNGNHERYQANCTHRRTVRRKDQCAGAGHRTLLKPRLQSVYHPRSADHVHTGRNGLPDAEQGFLLRRRESYPRNTDGVRGQIPEDGKGMHRTGSHHLRPRDNGHLCLYEAGNVGGNHTGGRNEHA